MSKISIFSLFLLSLMYSTVCNLNCKFLEDISLSWKIKNNVTIEMEIIHGRIKPKWMAVGFNSEDKIEKAEIYLTFFQGQLFKFEGL